MALSLSGTPKKNLVTSKKLGTLRTPGFGESSNTPRSNYVTPKSKKSYSTLNTPECFSKVIVETPVLKTRSSKNKEKDAHLSNLTVAVRIRPMNSIELAKGVSNVVRVRDSELILRIQPNAVAGMSTDHIFQYDHVFWSCDETHSLYANQEDVFMTIGKPLLNNAFCGYNACLFAYGQTGSGKSFSMMGKNMYEVVDIDCQDFSGIIPRFCRDIFDRVSKLDKNSVATVEVSYFEIYNEKIHDLLASQCNMPRHPLKVREHREWGPYVEDLNIKTVESYKELRNWLLIGNKNRATTATSMNEKSSRSHSIFSIEISLSRRSEDGDNSRRSRVSLVDLAGSERLRNSHNSDEKIREGVFINKSLLTLGKVINALSDQKKNHFVPYRDSVLTWLLRESLGGNSLTFMLATISPASTHLDETLATLRYACQARSIVNRARVNESPHTLLIRELRLEIERLLEQKQYYTCNSPSSLINDNCNEELEELRNKLTDTESKLTTAQKSWEERFKETKQKQLRELAEAEKYKAELESKVRVMKTLDNKINLSPYKTNFLDEVRGALTEPIKDLYENDIIDSIKDWCSKNNMICTLSSDSLTINDPMKSKQTFLSLKDIDFENIGDFMNSLRWIECVKPVNKLNKTDIMTSMNQIWQALGFLHPPNDDNELSLLFAKVNKSLQSFEAALLSHVKSTCQKTVTFRI